MTTNQHLDSARDWADIAVEQKAEIDALRGSLGRLVELLTDERLSFGGISLVEAEQIENEIASAMGLLGEVSEGKP